jgi:hypothetical protein
MDLQSRFVPARYPQVAGILQFEPVVSRREVTTQPASTSGSTPSEYPFILPDISKGWHALGKDWLGQSGSSG